MYLFDEGSRSNGQMKHVVMFSNHPLLIQGVESLLSQGEPVEFIGLELDGGRITAGTRNRDPDVIILEDGELNGESALAIINFLGERSGIQVIGLSPEQNTISLYRGEQYLTRGAEHLLSTIDDAARFRYRMERPSPSA